MYKNRNKQKTVLFTVHKLESSTVHKLESLYIYIYIIIESSLAQLKSNEDLEEPECSYVYIYIYYMAA